MARVVGPLFSTEASGSVYGLLVFAKNKSGPHVREHPRKTHLPEDCQVVVNNLFKQANRLWSAMDKDERHDWNTLARLKALPYSGHDLYVGHFIETEYKNTECWLLHQHPMPQPTQGGE